MNGLLCLDDMCITPLGAVKALPPQRRVESMMAARTPGVHADDGLRW